MADTPFGQTQSDAGLTKAPTKVELAENPGKYSGTQYDPVTLSVNRTKLQSVAGDDSADSLPFTMPFYTAYRWNPDYAQKAFAEEHDGHYLNVGHLSAEQKALLGL